MAWTTSTPLDRFAIRLKKWLAKKLHERKKIWLHLCKLEICTYISLAAIYGLTAITKILVAGWKHDSFLCYSMGARWFLRFLGPKLELPSMSAIDVLKELGTSRTHSAVIRCLTICQHIPVVRKNHKNQLTQQFDIICCLARGLALCIESKQIMSLLSCESATLKRGPQLCGQRCGPYLRH